LKRSASAAEIVSSRREPKCSMSPLILRM
jgi:hypothetical protein